MPDDLVVCFTLNRQSILGARSICAAADQQRRRPDGSPGLRIWPVPTRVELGKRTGLINALQLMALGVCWRQLATESGTAQRLTGALSRSSTCRITPAKRPSQLSLILPECPIHFCIPWRSLPDDWWTGMYSGAAWMTSHYVWRLCKDMQAQRSGRSGSFAATCTGRRALLAG
jgi:hypothetical protein